MSRSQAQRRTRSRRTLHFEPSRVHDYERIEEGDERLREAFALYEALRFPLDDEEEGL